MSFTIEILGSGGASTIPKPLCVCAICEEARKKSYPYKRTAPSVFIHGPDILIDTPEETKYQLERSNIRNINACFYSHWHPDHTGGYRVWEMNKNHRQLPTHTRTTPIYLAENIAQSFKEWQGLDEKFAFLEKNNLITQHVVTLGDSVTVKNATVTPFQLFESYAVGFDMLIDGKKILLVIDETFGWKPDLRFAGYDLVILPMGIIEFHPLTKRRVIPESHPILRGEPNFEYTLGLIDTLKPQKTVLLHFEENDQLSFDELSTLQKHLNNGGLNIEMAVDQMKIAF